MPKSDITNELHTQIQYRLIEKLSESERRYRELVESLREIVFKCDPKGHLMFLNQAWTTILGYRIKDVLKQSLKDFIIPGDHHLWEQILDRLHQHASVRQELRFCDYQGETVWLELSILASNQAEFSGSLVDITDRKQAEVILQQTNDELESRVQQRTAALTHANQELMSILQTLQHTQGQLVQAEKMSSLGQLVAGIAHEINNPVNFIYGNLAHLQEYAQDLMQLIKLYQLHYPQPVSTIQTSLEETDLDFLQTDFPKIIQSMHVGTERIRQTILSLRNFSRIDESDFKEVDIHKGIDSALMLLKHRFKANSGSSGITLIQKYGNLPLVNCYPGQLNQVIMQILTNALDAIDTRNSQRIKQEDPGQILIQTLTLDSQWVQIKIADNGIGMSQNIQKNIFDPFFTTKPVGQGTGMGMAISYQIITEKHGGNLQCHSTLNQGTEFIIQIPQKHH